MPIIQGLKQAAFLVGKYSQHRLITGKDGTPRPIITFSTQFRPVLQAVAVAYVLDAWAQDVVKTLSDEKAPFETRHALAVAFKAVVLRQTCHCIREITERCGAQGTFEHNFMGRFEVRTSF
jgi:acyl-CoA oxidase